MLGCKNVFESCASSGGRVKGDNNSISLSSFGAGDINDQGRVRDWCSKGELKVLLRGLALWDLSTD